MDRERPDDDGADVLALVRRRPQTIESIAVDNDWSLGRSARSLARLDLAGWIIEVGGWYEALDAEPVE